MVMITIMGRKVLFSVLVICAVAVDSCSAYVVGNRYYSNDQDPAEDLSYPRHVHLSLGATPSSMVVTWTTFSPSISLIEYGQKSLSQKAMGNSTVFLDAGTERRAYYTHRVTLYDLEPGALYIYHVGSEKGWSDIFYFKAPINSPSWNPWIGVYGDMGNENAQSLGRLQEEVAHGTLEFILHVGDFAYNLNWDNGRVGDSFMDQIQSIAAYVPYMTCVGNHESATNFSHYKHRFTMPGGDGEGIFYSFNLGLAHIIAFSTEVFYYTEFGVDQIKTQMNWLIQDLKEANLVENRKERPWIITIGHRPMYCALKNYSSECSPNDRVRIAVEKLFYDNGVDLSLSAHEHLYERIWPVYDRVVCNGSFQHPYTEPRAPVHIVTGSAGCREKTDLPKSPSEFLAYGSSDYGYTRMKILNETHLYMEQISDDQDGKVIDSITIIKSQHGPGTYHCGKH